MEGFGGPMGGGSMGWMPDDRRLWFLSERDGWMHLYLVDAAEAGAAAAQLTSGRFEVSAMSLSQDKTKFYFASSERHPGERHLYSMPIAGGEPTRLTSMTGLNLGEVSPDGTTLAFVYSYITKPPEVYLAPAAAGARAKQVTTTPTAEWLSFKWAGAALRPVTDWTHYNHNYASSILNEPQGDGEAYQQSSPIYYVARLKGALLNCHGMADTNVFFQDSVRLVQRLIELRKDTWQLAVYPVGNHGFERETSWVDEYKRIFRLFEDNLRLKAARSAS
jgi:dipeptidyl aminopeptidase/acylaminoacyl peptidase